MEGKTSKWLKIWREKPRNGCIQDGLSVAQEKLLVLTREKGEAMEEAKTCKAEAAAAITEAAMARAEAAARIKEARQQRLAGK